MVYNPSNISELTAKLAEARAKGERGIVFRLDSFSRVLECTPEDMTVTVEAGITLSALQEHLAQRGQVLPIDPPHPETASLADILNANASGPRRFGYGTLREHLLGLKVVLADRRVIHCGGKVVKNVAGYDLNKLFVGSRGSLGVIVEATFKVRPLPEAEQFVCAGCDSLQQVDALLEAVHKSEITPVVLDLQSNGASESGELRVGTSESSITTSAPRSQFRLIVGLAGTREEVDWQLDQAAKLEIVTPTDLAYESSFWSSPEAVPTHRLSILPSRLTETLQSLNAREFVARAGNGVIYYRGGDPPPKRDVPLALMRRIKESYDPTYLFPDMLEAHK